jgi:hypothetical protein
MKGTAYQERLDWVVVEVVWSLLVVLWSLLVVEVLWSIL